MGFAIGPGSIPWFYVSELFSTSFRGAANAYAISSNWLANFCVGLLFLPWKVSLSVRETKHFVLPFAVSRRRLFNAVLHRLSCLLPRLHVALCARDEEQNSR